MDVEELVLGKLNDELMADLDQEAVANYVKDMIASKSDFCNFVFLLSIEN